MKYVLIILTAISIYGCAHQPFRANPNYNPYLAGPQASCKVDIDCKASQVCFQVSGEYDPRENVIIHSPGDPLKSVCINKPASRDEFPKTVDPIDTRTE